MDWSYLAGWFDNSGSIYEKRTRQRLGLEARLRFSSYDRAFLEELRSLTGGSISRELHSPPYYRLTVTGYFRVETVLTRLLPYLRLKHRMVEDWLTLHKVKAEIGRLTQKLSLPRRKYQNREIRQLQRAVRQLQPPPASVTD